MPENIKIDKIGVRGTKKSAHGFVKTIKQGVVPLARIMRLGEVAQAYLCSLSVTGQTVESSRA